MGLLRDINQDDKIKRLERKVKKLEKQIKGERAMSRLLQEIVGHNVKFDYDFGVYRFEAFDEDWVKLSSTDKKGNTKITYKPIDEIESIEIVD
jgi:DNA polymerase III epsilon subunit-like protein